MDEQKQDKDEMVFDFTDHFRTDSGTPPKSIPSRFQKHVSAPSPLSDKQLKLLEKYVKTPQETEEELPKPTTVSKEPATLNPTITKLKVLLNIEDESKLLSHLIKVLAQVKSLESENETLTSKLKKLSLTSKLHSQDVDRVEIRKKEIEQKYHKEKQQFKSWSKEKDVEINKLKHQIDLKDKKMKKTEDDMFKLRQQVQKSGTKAPTPNYEKCKKDNARLKKKCEALAKEIEALKRAKHSPQDALSETSEVVVIK